MNHAPNPYSSPEHFSQDEVEQRYQPKAFSLSGRIGRLRFIGYNMLYSLVLLGIIIAGVIFGGALASSGQDIISMVLTTAMVIMYVPYVVFWFAAVVRRLNDLNQTGWLSLLMLIPLLNIIFGFYLLFWPGTRGSNRYGPAPTVNSRLALLVLIPVFIAVLGILAAVAIPAYQDFLQRAQAIQFQEQE